MTRKIVNQLRAVLAHVESGGTGSTSGFQAHPEFYRRLIVPRR